MQHELGAVLSQHRDEGVAIDQSTVAAVGVPSSSGTVGWKYDSAAYNLYAIKGSDGAWRCEMISRGLDGDGTRIVERKRMMLMGEQ